MNGIAHRERPGDPVYCPGCGAHSLRQVSSQRFECGGCTFTFYKNVAAAVAAIIECPGGIIVTRRAAEPRKGRIGLPGGFVDERETLEDALIREIHEEVGSIRLYDLAYFGSFPNTYPFEGIDYFTVDSIFLCRSDSTELTPEAAEIEHAEIVDPKELDLDEVAFPSLRTALERYRKRIRTRLV